MKYKSSISVDEETILLLREKLRDRTFRNKSHAFRHKDKTGCAFIMIKPKINKW